MIFNFANGHNVWAYPLQFPALKRWLCRTFSLYFNIETIVRGTKFIKACRSLLAKNCHAKGSELTPRIKLQLQWRQASWLYRSRKIFAVCSMVLRPNESIFCRVTGSVVWRRCTWFPQPVISTKNFWRKKFPKTFSRELIFTSWCLIAKIAKISHYTVPKLY